MASFSVHFDGPITIDHKVTIRVLAKTYEHMQRAIDRAYLIEQYGDVWKHARLKADQYLETDFIAPYPREGGIILEAVRDGAGPIIDRIAAAIRPVFEKAVQHGLEQHASLDVQLNQRRADARALGLNTRTFDEVLADSPPDWPSAYSNRSVIKEIDQLVTQITPERLADSFVELTLDGVRPHLPYKFTPQVARNFHSLASQRDLGPPMVITSIIRSLDRGNRYTKPSAKIANLATEREVNLHLSGAEDFDALHPFHNGQEVRLYVCPIIEALGFDLKGGDLMFLAAVT